MKTERKLIVFQDSFKSIVSTIAKLDKIVDESEMDNDELQRCMTLNSYLRNAQLLVELMTSETLIRRKEELENSPEKQYP